MKQSNISCIKEKLSVLFGQSISDVHRAGATVCLGIGDKIEVELPKRTAPKTFVKERVLVSEYALHIQCAFRLTCGDKIIAATSDIFQPTEEALENPDFDWDNFNYDVKGGNQFDWVMENWIAPYYAEFVVKEISVNKFGDLKISFQNDYVLELMVDVSLDAECWRFFSPGVEDSHLVVLGTGIEDAE